MAVAAWPAASSYHAYASDRRASQTPSGLLRCVTVLMFCPCSRSRLSGVTAELQFVLTLPAEQQLKALKRIAKRRKKEEEERKVRGAREEVTTYRLGVKRGTISASGCIQPVYSTSRAVMLDAPCVLHQCI